MPTAAINGLLAMQAIKNDALAGVDLPKRLKLLNWGANTTKRGTVTVGTKTLSALAAKQAELGFDKIGIDYEHQSLPGHPNFKAPPREYAAYGTPLVIEGDGLYLDAIEWTPSGQANARNYVDLSPTPLIEDGEVVFLHSVALCPQGAVDGLTFFSAEFPNQSPTNKKTMKPELITLLASLFGVAETATEDEILAAGKTFAEDYAKKKEAGPVAMDAITAALKPVTDKVTALSAQLENQTREAIIADALRAGKLIPASVKGLPLDNLRAVVADLPADQVPLEKRTPEGVAALSATLSATDLAVAAQLGLTPEEFKK